MQCGQVEVTGSGTDDLFGSGVIATKLYSNKDAIFSFDVYNVGSETTWQIPGPPLYDGGNRLNQTRVWNSPKGFRPQRS